MLGEWLGSEVDSLGLEGDMDVQGSEEEEEEEEEEKKKSGIWVVMKVKKKVRRVLSQVQRIWRSHKTQTTMKGCLRGQKLTK